MSTSITQHYIIKTYNYFKLIIKTYNTLHNKTRDYFQLNDYFQQIIL